jgi:hypothetical protein
MNNTSIPPAEASRPIVALPRAQSAESNGAAAENLAAIQGPVAWPAELLAVAEQQHIRTYLEPMLKATREIFPTARWIKVYVKDDPEIPGQRDIIFDVRIGGLTSAQYRAAHKAWIVELLGVFSRPLEHTFCLLLDIAAE